MAVFEDALKYVFDHEGGYVNDKDDRGGPTNMGVTLKTAQRHGITTVEALKAITYQQVVAIYKTDYWRFDGINDQRVATKLFDMAINMGLAMAVKLAQRACNGIRKILAVPAFKTLSVDGRYGPLTESAINSVHPDVLLARLVAVSVARYKEIAENDPTQMKFLKGWTARARRIPGEKLNA